MPEPKSATAGAEPEENIGFAEFLAEYPPTSMKRVRDLAFRDT